MNFYPKILFVFIIALFTGCEKLPSKIKFFENYDLSTGEYKLLVFGTEGEWIDDYRDFYIDEIGVLKKCRKNGFLSTSRIYWLVLMDI